MTYTCTSLITATTSLTLSVNTLLFVIWCQNPIVRSFITISVRCCILFQWFSLWLTSLYSIGCTILDHPGEIFILFCELCSCCSCTSYRGTEGRWFFHVRCFRFRDLHRDRSWLQGEGISWIWKWKFHWLWTFNWNKSSNCSIIYLWQVISVSK